MIKLLPKWYIHAEEDLDNLIIKIANKNSIDPSLVMDSNIIKKCKEAILLQLVHIQELMARQK